MKEELEAYKVPTSNFWKALPVMGYTGYDAMEAAHNKGWHAISSWGKDGYDLGQWPYVIIFYRTVRTGTDEESQLTYQIAYYVEGDVDIWNCPTEAIREQITDELAFAHWKWDNEEWVKDYETVEQLPADLRGPCRFELEREVR